MLLALVKKASVRRKKFANSTEKGGEVYEPLKVLLMSATMDIEKMQSFWKDSPILLIPGKTFPVEVSETFIENWISKFMKVISSTPLIDWLIDWSIDWLIDMVLVF